MKLVFKLFGGLVVLLLIVLVAVWFYMGAIIKGAVERVGPEVTGTNVQLESANLSIFDGSGSLKGFVIGNPSGFNYPNAFTLGSVGLKIDTSTLTSDVIVINDVSIDAPKITYESGAAGDNFQTILRNIQQRVGGDQSGKAEDGAGSAKKIIIERFSLSNGDITWSHSRLENDLNVPMPDLVLTGIGRNTNGVTAQQAAKQIFEQITEAAMKAVAQSALADAARERVDEAKQQARDRINEELENSEDVQKAKSLLDGLFN